MRKQIIFTFFALFVFSIMSISSVRASLLPTVVNGHIYASDGITPVSGASVTVSCNGIDLFDTTDSNGFYAVEFIEGCGIGSTVDVTSGGVTESGTVASTVLIKNIVYVNLAIPEFGLIGAGIALAGSLLVFTLIRKKK